MQTIREAKIIVHLEQGKVELKAPDISNFLKQQEQQLALTKRIADEAERLQRAQASLNMPGFSPGGGGGVPPSAPAAPGGGAPGSKEASEQLQRQLELTKQLEEATNRLTAAMNKAAESAASSGGGRGTYEERDRERILKIMQQEEQSLARLRSSMSALGGAVQQAGEGFFRLARAAALLGSSNESLELMVRNLVQVQAYWDVFAGMLSIVQAMTNAQKALAAAQSVYTVALGASTLATQAFMVALIEATAALLGFLAPFVAIGVVIGAVIWAGVAAWDALTTSEEEAAEAAKKYNEEVAKQTQDAIDKMNTMLDLEKDLEEVRRSQMSLDQQQASLAVSRRTASGVASGLVDLSQFGGPAAEKPDLEAARKYAMEAARLANEEIALAEKRRDAEIEIRQEKLKQLESAERALSTAQQQLQIEEDKLRSFQAQVGAMSKFEQQQLIAIRDKLRAGQAINPFEEEFLAANGGEGGRQAADAIRARRAAAAGIGVDFWNGTEGAGAAKDMAEASDKVAKAMEELAKLLGDAGSAAEAKARYEAQIKAIEEASAKEVEALKKAWAENLSVLETITEKLKEIEQAVVTG